MLNQMKIDNKYGVLSYKSFKEKDISSSEAVLPQEAKALLLEEFYYEIIETTSTKSLLKKIMKRQKKAKKR